MKRLRKVQSDLHKTGKNYIPRNEIELGSTEKCYLRGNK